MDGIRVDKGTKVPLYLNVSAKIRVMPSGVNTDLEEIKSKLNNIVDKFGKLHKTEIKPIAFGLKSIEALILLNDEKGGIEEIESLIQKIDGVGGFEVLEVSRM